MCVGVCGVCVCVCVVVVCGGWGDGNAIVRQLDVATARARQAEVAAADASALLTELANAELLLAQQQAALDTHEIWNSIRVEVQTIETYCRAEVSELNTDRRRMVAGHAQRPGDLSRRLQNARTAEASARLCAKPAAEGLRRATCAPRQRSCRCHRSSISYAHCCIEARP